MNQLMGLEEEVKAAKKALEPIIKQRDEAKVKIQAQRERLEAIEVSPAR
jgi:hypothetical protein